MSHGYWLTRAQLHLADAAEHLAATTPASNAEALAMTADSTSVYRQLLRNIDLVLGDEISPDHRASPPARFSRFQEALSAIIDAVPVPR